MIEASARDALAAPAPQVLALPAATEAPQAEPAATGSALVNIALFFAAPFIGLAYIIAAFAIEPFAAFLSHFRKYLRRVEQATGALLVLTGIAVLTGSINQMSVWLLEARVEVLPVLCRTGVPVIPVACFRPGAGIHIPCL